MKALRQSPGGGWALALLLWLLLALYWLRPQHRLAWQRGSGCLADALRGRLCQRWR